VTDPKHSLAIETLRTFGEARLPVNGASMLPTQWPGDLLEVRRTDPAEIRLGDLVVFDRHGRLIAHRVIADSPVTLTQGDRLRHPDAPLSGGEILGCVTAIYRGRRRLPPGVSVGNRMAAWLLSRSEFCTRVALGLHRRLRL